MVALALLALAFGCPRDASLGSPSYFRGGMAHRVSLGDCSDRVIGKATSTEMPSPWPSPSGRYLASIRSTWKAKAGMQSICGRVFGPFAALGYSTGFYGHHEWPIAWLP